MGYLDQFLAQIPPDELAAMTSAPGGSGWSPLSSPLDTGGMSYSPDIVYGQGSNDVGNNQLVGYHGTVDGQSTAPGNPFAKYDSSGKLTGQGQFQSVDNSILPAIEIVGGAALGFSALGSAAGAGGAASTLGGDVTATAAGTGGAASTGGSMGMFDDLGYGDAMSADGGVVSSGGPGFGDLGYDTVASADGGTFDPSGQIGGFDTTGLAGAGGGGAGSGQYLSSLGKALSGGGAGLLQRALGGIIGGADSSRAASHANDLAQQLIARSDPFYQYRAGYGQKLQDLEKSKDVTSIPGYQAGLESVQRAGAAQGFTGSGNMMKALQDYGGNFYNTELTRLAHLAGADVQPGAGFKDAAGLIGAGDRENAAANQSYLGGAGALLSGLGGIGNPSPSMGGYAPQGTDLGNYAPA